MKRNFKSFIAGMLTALLLSGGTISAMAADGMLHLTAYPVQVMVNGEVFQPNDALVFSYNGITYAPVRALAETYGLQVGYDNTKHLITVNNHSSGKAAAAVAAPGNFAANWQVKPKPSADSSNEKVFTATFNGSLSLDEFKAWWKAQDQEELQQGAAQMAKEAQKLAPGSTVNLYFSYGKYNLGNALASGDYATANFDIAAAWIK